MDHEELKCQQSEIYLYKLIKADINGMINILRKLVDDLILELRTYRGTVNRSTRLRLSFESTEFKC